MATHIVDIPFLISELLYIPRQDKLIFISVLPIVEDANAFQVYSINLKNILEMIKLTTDTSIKQNLQLVADRKRIMYQIYSIGTSEGSPNIIQQRLYSVDLTTGLVERINVQVYSQMSSTAPSVLHVGFNGTYDSISSSATDSVVFIFSSLSNTQDAFFISNIDELTSPTAVTSENSQYDQIDLPEAQAYQWTNEDDNRTIEGILYYPPGKFLQYYPLNSRNTVFPSIIAIIHLN